MTHDPKVREAIEELDSYFAPELPSFPVNPAWQVVRAALVAKGEGAGPVAWLYVRGKSRLLSDQAPAAEEHGMFDAITPLYTHPAPKPASEAVKPDECNPYCPPEQVCDYCQRASPEPARDAGGSGPRGEIATTLACLGTIMDHLNLSGDPLYAEWVAGAYRLIERLAADRDKFKWQVRDTCRRAESAERSLAEARKALEITAKRYREVATRLEAEAGIIDAALSRES